MVDSANVAEGIVVLKFLKKDLSAESQKWLVGKLTESSPNHVPGLNCDVVEGTNGLVFHVWAGTLTLLNDADIMGLKKEARAQGTTSVECLTRTDRQKLVLHHIESIRYTSKDNQCEDLPTFHRDQVLFSKCRSKGILTYFPIHSPGTIKRLDEIWVKKIISDQPIEDVLSYFGESVAMYFSFLGFYTKWLIPPTVLGIFFHLLRMFVSFNVTGYFCFFNVIWSCIFFVLWRRKSTVLAFRWNSLNYSRFEDPRPEFVGESTEEDPVTHKIGPCCNYKSKYYKFYFGSLPIILFFLIVSASLALAYFRLEDLLRWSNHPDDHSDYRKESLTWPMWTASLALVVVYGALVYALDVVYRRIALLLNDWENHRLQSTYDNYLIAKLVVFNFVNYFGCLFYVAFYMKDFELLHKNLAALLITWQIIQQIQEAVLPYLKYKADKKKSLAGEEVSENNGGREEDIVKPSVAHQIRKDLAKMDYDSTMDDFLEMFLQFGYVFLFSAIYPLASLFALINNLIEVRTDAFKLCHVFRKPHPRQCDGIGTWMMAFELLGVVAVITNCSLLSMDQYVKNNFASSWQMSEFDIIFFFVVVEHCLLFVKAAILYLVSSTPYWVKVKLAEKEYRAHQALVEEINKSHSRAPQDSVTKKDL